MPFKEDLDRTPIAVPDDIYQYSTLHSPTQVWDSIISTQVTVPASVKTLAELLATATTDVVDEVAAAADGSTLTFSGTLAPHAHMNIEDGDSVTFTATVSAGSVDITDTATPGLLAGTNCTGTIDYVTGEWTLVFTGTAPDDSTNIVVDYTWFYVVDPNTTVNALWLAPTGAATEIFATYSPDGTPSATEGILLSEAIFLSGQPNMIDDAKFFGASTLMDIEVLI
jgi:hypothetical protein